MSDVGEWVWCSAVDSPTYDESSGFSQKTAQRWRVILQDLEGGWPETTSKAIIFSKPLNFILSIGQESGKKWKYDSINLKL